MSFPRKFKTARKLPKAINLPATTTDELTIPEHFRCPISLELMKDPVTTPTGITYDRPNIERWLDMRHSTCPVTHATLHGDDLIPNHTIRRMIQDWCVANGPRGIERIPTPRIPIRASDASELLSEIRSACQLLDNARCLELARKVKSLSKESDWNRLCFVSNGAPSALAIAFRMSSTESHELSADILGALVALFPFDDEIVISESQSPETLDSLIQIMKHGDADGKLNAALMLKKLLSSGGATSKAAAERDDVVEALTALIRVPHSPQIVKASLVATFYLVSGDETVAAKFTKAGLIPLVLEILVDSDRSTTEKALAVLDRLCSDEAGREVACGHALTVPLLAKKMFRGSDMMTEFAVSALWKLCKRCKGMCLGECLQVGMFQKLLLLLQIGCREGTKERATEMLKLLSGCAEKLHHTKLLSAFPLPRFAPRYPIRFDPPSMLSIKVSLIGNRYETLSSHRASPASSHNQDFSLLNNIWPPAMRSALGRTKHSKTYISRKNSRLACSTNASITLLKITRSFPKWDTKRIQEKTRRGNGIVGLTVLRIRLTFIVEGPMSVYNFSQQAWLLRLVEWIEGWHAFFYQRTHDCSDQHVPSTLDNLKSPKKETI
ncbi:hypothetical protein HPP92_010984 [Vanilla planifolia]|uniref:U-box domain-containing protein n=1 Tax=Vanilla planifolia TaxID=51239 RepID=A0A835QUW2_VANPL|nr:hypothetical protein HPP92_010984 [Vanilla planifolia]